MIVDLMPLALAAITQLEPLIITGIASLGFKVAWPAIVKYLGEQNAGVLQDRVNHVLSAAIGYAVQKSDSLVASHGLSIDVKNVMVGFAVDYATKHAPELMTQVGDVTEKVLARFDVHPAVQGLAYAAQPAPATAAAPAS